MNQYANVGGSSFSYDGGGNLTATESATHAYDVYNRLTGANAATLAYDPTGRLYETVASSVRTRFQYDGVEMIAEYNASATLLRRYVHGPGIDEPVVWYEGFGTSDRCFLAQDQLSSVISVSDSSGASLSINTYDEYGVPGSSNAGRFQYTGQMWLPEAGLYHYRARAYAPTLGRFLQSDPILYAGGMNIYGYLGGDPINGTDPYGLCDLPTPQPDGGGGDDCDTGPPITIVGRVGDTVDGQPVSDSWNTNPAATFWEPASPHAQTINGEYVPFEPDEIVITAIHGIDRSCTWSPAQCANLLNGRQITPGLFGDFAWTFWGSGVPLPRLGLIGRICGCFVEGTLVATPDGLRPIDDIAVGDSVLARNPETGETTIQTVTELIRPEPRDGPATPGANIGWDGESGINADGGKQERRCVWRSVEAMPGSSDTWQFSSGGRVRILATGVSLLSTYNVWASWSPAGEQMYCRVGGCAGWRQQLTGFVPSGVQLPVVFRAHGSYDWHVKSQGDIPEAGGDHAGSAIVSVQVQICRQN